ncbi:esterase-like activity of phytase family protein [uncultured Mucilaginibacter sp.]|uniref:esterase-like activity of phytase family protein n=1 Tax=uncultured Mucilaginibacter sp. TaxID=797541 RepID=UPI002623A1DE|nr:esterase-like activity of phytase family protein [uncultured Mucilaginibacter sp.]
MTPTNPCNRLQPILFLALFFCCISACSSLKKVPVKEVSATISSLKFLDEYDLPYNLQYQNTTVGGLSGIDYDAKNDVYYIISDDRSEINPSRFYTAKISLAGKEINSVKLIAVTTLKQQNNQPYPDLKQHTKETVDPEAIRYNPKTNQLIWSSEGERIVKQGDTVLIDPAVNIISTSGKLINTLPLPNNLKMHATETGPRRNGVLEGLTFADNYQTLYVNLEEPLYQDGPRADVTPNNALVRIYKFDWKTKQNTAQYAYQLEPVAYPAKPENGFKINGIPDILSINKNQLLVTERSFSDGKEGCVIRVFLADLTGADNVVDNASLLKNPPQHLIRKKLLLNMDDLKIYIDNVEGATFGPTLPNGHHTIIFVADNNFAKTEKTQFLLFEVIP